MRSPVLAFAFAALIILPAAQAPAQELAARQQVGNRVTENVPEIPTELIERLNRYQNTRGASASGCAVRDSGHPAWFLMFDDEGHGFARKSNSDYFGAASVLFWQRYLLDGE